MAKKKVAKRNPQDVTLRNNRARQQEITQLSRRFDALKAEVAALADRVVNHESRVSALENESAEGFPV